MIKTKEAGGSTDFVHHPMLKQSLSSFPAPEKISLLAVEVCLLEYPLGNTHIYTSILSYFIYMETISYSVY